MNHTEKSRAIFQLHRIRSMKNFLENDSIDKAIKDASPEPNPPDAGTLGFDVPLWAGFGIVGIWSGLDAYAERMGFTKPECKECRKKCLVARLKAAASVPSHLVEALKEIEDIRHLFAHNFAGQADKDYFGFGTRHVISPTGTKLFTSGARFDGVGVPMDFTQVWFYADKAEEIVRLLP